MIIYITGIVINLHHVHVFLIYPQIRIPIDGNGVHGNRQVSVPYYNGLPLEVCPLQGELIAEKGICSKKVENMRGLSEYIYIYIVKIYMYQFF